MARKSSRISTISSLEATYEAATHRARRRLASRFALENVPLESPDYPGRPAVVTPSSKPKAPTIKEDEEILGKRWREVWRIDVHTELQARLEPTGASLDVIAFSLLVAIPPRFADELPAIYLSQENFERVFPIPHLDRNRLLCTFDAAEVIPLCDRAAGIVYEVVERALTLLVDGLTGSNHGDFEEEFSAYWAQECEGNHAISLVNIGEVTKEVWSFSTGKSRLWGATHILADSREDASLFLRSMRGTSRDNIETGRRALYLPLPSLGRPPFPKNNRELWQRLGEVSPAAQTQLLRFLVKAPRPCAVLFSVPSEQGHTLGLWWQPKWDVGRAKVGGRAGRQHAAAVPGFRSNRASVVQELKRIAGDSPLERATIERLDTQRLQTRTSGHSATTLSRRINIVGCGALGSHLAGVLAASGEISDMSLFDPQILSVENVPRHLCPLTMVGHFKTDAVSLEISKRSPLMRFHKHPYDILDVLREKPDALKMADVTLLALGDFATERRINRLALEQPGLYSPLCFVWIEPLALGGHALWFPKRENAMRQPCFECAFDERLLPPQRIVSNPLQYSRREAGCQTTFVPYGGLDLVTFLAALGRFVLRCLSTPPDVPLLWSWAGDLESAQNWNVDILNPSDLAPFSSSTQPLSVSPVCPSCGAPK